MNGPQYELIVMFLFIAGLYWVVNRYFNRDWAIKAAAVLAAVFAILLIGWGI